MPSVGRRVPRKEGAAKVTGTARYIDDISFPGMLHGTTVRSTISRGKILSVRSAFDARGCPVADHRDTRGKHVAALTGAAQPSRAARETRHAAEPILLVAHREKERLLSAKFEIGYRPTEPNFDPARSERVFKEIR